jgi:hypothetical protein
MTTGLTGQLDELYKWASALSTLRTEQEAAQKAA